MPEPARWTGAAAIGWSVYGCIAVGILGILGAVLFFMAQPDAAGICLLAAAVAFGLLANAMLRQ